MCIVSGLQKHLTAKREAAFTIEAIDADGRRKHTGGEAFFIAIRGASRVRARVTDHQDGTYSAEWTPQCSGDYHVAVSLFGVSLKGSPFSVHVQGPEPFAPNCEVSSSSRSDISISSRSRSSSSRSSSSRSSSSRSSDAAECPPHRFPLASFLSGPRQRVIRDHCAHQLDV